MSGMSDDILTMTPPPADARLAYGSDPNQFLDLRIPLAKEKPKPYPLVINIHGGYWRAKYNLDHAGHLCAALTGKGLATANLEFRRVGNEGGGWPGTFRRYSFRLSISCAKRAAVTTWMQQELWSWDIPPEGNWRCASRLTKPSVKPCRFARRRGRPAARVQASPQPRCRGRVSARHAQRSSGPLPRSRPDGAFDPQSAGSG